eukprot:7809044-Alexandrium_andersonii.AAC.1
MPEAAPWLPRRFGPPSLVWRCPREGGKLPIKDVLTDACAKHRSKRVANRIDLIDSASSRPSLIWRR